MLNLEHLTGLKDLSRENIEYIINLALKIEDKYEKVFKGEGSCQILKDKLLATFFYEPSTRTRLSFESAMNRLGGNVISMADAKKMSSAWKGETLADTIRTIENYADIIALRHSEVGAAKEAASYSNVPILNAGDGSNEHPTQALLDILTIYKERDTIDGLKVLMVGDLKHTRSINSLTFGLSNFDVEFIFVSPPDFKLSKGTMDVVKERNIPYKETENLEESVSDADVVYVCRIQKERLENPEDLEKIKGAYYLNRSILEKTDKIKTVLHHLPRIGELAEDIDSYPGAAYFRQTYNGVLVRAALLTIFLKRTSEI